MSGYTTKPKRLDLLLMVIGFNHRAYIKNSLFVAVLFGTQIVERIRLTLVPV